MTRVTEGNISETELFNLTQIEMEEIANGTA